MAKINFQKLNTKVDTEVRQVSFNGVDIEIKQYVSLEQKITIIENLTSFCLNDSEYFYNPIAVKVLLDLNLVEYYTNISLTAQQKKKIFTIYDHFVSSGLLELIKSNIPEKELIVIQDYLYSSLDGIYKYNNSIHGVLTAMNADYENLSTDANDIRNNLAANSKEILALKDILSNNVQ